MSVNHEEMRAYIARIRMAPRKITFLDDRDVFFVDEGGNSMFEFMTVRELYEIVFSGSHVELDSIEYVQLQGWIRTNRCSGKLGFI